VYEYIVIYLIHTHSMSKSSSGSLEFVGFYIIHPQKKKKSGFYIFAGGLDLKKIFIPCSCIFHVGLVK